MDSIVITTADVRGPPPYGEGFQSQKYYIVISKTAIDIKCRYTNYQSGHGSQIGAINDFMHLKVTIPEFMIKMIKQLLPYSCGHFEPLYTDHYRNVFQALAVLSEEKIFTVDSKEIDHLKKENDRLHKFLDIERKELEIVKSYLKKEQSANVNILVDKNELDRIKTLLKTEQSTNTLVANKNYELNKENETLQKELDVVKSLLKKEQSITKSYLEENEKIKKDNAGIIEKLGIINKKFQEIKKIIYKKIEL
jgi:hypothetical protein